MMNTKPITLLILPLILATCGKSAPRIAVVCEENNVGNYIIKWETTPRLEGDVKIYASTDPGYIPENTPAATANITDLRTTVVSNNPAQRYYYTVLFAGKHRVKTATRNVSLPGIQNFRDMGGYPAYSQHKQVRWGMLYRSAEIDTLYPASLQKLKNMRLKTIIDLRAPSESKRSPLKEKEFNLVRIPIDVGDLENVVKNIDEGQLTNDTVYHIVEQANREMIYKYTKEFRKIFDLLLDKDNYPLLIHCSSGKGRTGVVAALIFSALGVDEETIMDDYRLSNNYFDIASASQQAYSLPVPYQEAITTLYSAHTEFLNAAKDAAECSYGDVGTYLRKGIGLTKDETRELRGILLEERGL